MFDDIKAPEPELLDTKKSQKEQDTLEGGKKSIQLDFLTIFKWFLRAGALMLLILFIVRFAHLVLPHTWRWLCPDDINKIDSMLFSSAFGGAILAYLRDFVFARENGKD